MFQLISSGFGVSFFSSQFPPPGSMEQKARKAVTEALGPALSRVDEPIIDYLVGTATSFVISVPPHSCKIGFPYFFCLAAMLFQFCCFTFFLLIIDLFIYKLKYFAWVVVRRYPRGLHGRRWGDVQGRRGAAAGRLLRVGAGARQDLRQAARPHVRVRQRHGGTTILHRN